MEKTVVIMGVAGCGKSSLARALAEALGWQLIEGDDFHSDSSRAKMSQGIALTDEDRRGWLARLAQALQEHPQGAVLTCSALKKIYREQLRAAVPALPFVFLEIDRAEARRRVEARSATHFFSASLVEDQFATLEPPQAESRVLALRASDSPDALRAAVLHWLQQPQLIRSAA